MQNHFPLDEPRTTMGSRFLILVRFPQQPNSWQNYSAFSPSSFVFALVERKNEGQKMESTMLPQAKAALCVVPTPKYNEKNKILFDRIAPLCYNPTQF